MTIYLNFKLPSNKKIIFYPAQFWAHKNHKYIIDAAEILKKKIIQNIYLFFVEAIKEILNILKI